MQKRNNQSGFTLIELLVVIAIMGLLSSVLLTTLSLARQKGRDAKRKADMVQMQTALEVYFNTNFSYPTTTGSWWSASGSCGSGTLPKVYTGANGYIPNLAPTFVGNLPSDPRPAPTTNCSGYNYRSDGTNYKIISNSVSGVGGPETYPSAGQSFYDPVRPTSAWMVTNNPTATAAW
jgi:prepilin-type N-terminal cleavage/methylation domain-containing protein